MAARARLSRIGENGVSLYEQLLQVEAATGKWPEDQPLLEPPPGAELAWDIFWELRQTCKSGFEGSPQPIGFTELAAWQSARGFHLDNALLDMLLEMDAAYLRQWHSDASREIRRRRSAPKKPAARR